MSNSSVGPPSSTLHPETRFRRRGAAWRWSRLGLIFGLPGLLGIVVADGAASAEMMLGTAAQALRSARADGVGGFRIIDIRPGLAA